MEREQTAYSAFRGGFRADVTAPPHWNDLEPWVRDALKVAHAQGKLDANADARRANEKASEFREALIKCQTLTPSLMDGDAAIERLKDINTYIYRVLRV